TLPDSNTWTKPEQGRGDDEAQRRSPALGRPSQLVRHRDLDDAVEHQPQPEQEGNDRQRQSRIDQGEDPDANAEASSDNEEPPPATLAIHIGGVEVGDTCDDPEQPNDESDDGNRLPRVVEDEEPEEDRDQSQHSHQPARAPGVLVIGDGADDAPNAGDEE